MLSWWGRLVSSLQSEKGAALAEWGLLVVLIAIIAMIAVTASGSEISETYSEISSSLDKAG